MTADELARVHTERWPRPSVLSNKQYTAMLRQWGQDFAGRELDSIDREEARVWGLANPGAVRYVRAAVNDAHHDGLCTQNVWSGLRISKPRRERYFPSEDEVQALIRAAEEPLRGRIRFSAYTGLRLGEMLAVRPCDFTLPLVRVCRQLNAMGDYAAPKGNLKDRTAFVPEPSWAEGLAPPILARESEHGAPLWPIARHVHDQEWRRLRKRLELPENFVWHSLRHHAATWFLDQGASFEDVAIQLGHDDSGQQVRETYSHMSREKALDRLEAVVS